MATLHTERPVPEVPAVTWSERVCPYRPKRAEGWGPLVMALVALATGRTATFTEEDFDGDDGVARSFIEYQLKAVGLTKGTDFETRASNGEVSVWCP